MLRKTQNAFKKLKTDVQSQTNYAKMYTRKYKC